MAPSDGHLTTMAHLNRDGRDAGPWRGNDLVDHGRLDRHQRTPTRHGGHAPSVMSHQPSPPRPAPRRAFVNGRILTMALTPRSPEVVVIEDDRIAAVGD